MFSTRKCSAENCNDFSVTGSKFCFRHIEDPGNYMKETLSMLSDCDNLTNFKLCRGNVSDVKIPCKSILTSKFSETVFTNVSFEDVAIQLCFYDFCEFHNCRFKASDIRYSVFAGSLFKDCEFSDSEILHTNFNGAKIFNTSFHSCDLYYSSFISSGIQDSEFRDCNLKKVSYGASNRYNVSFKYSNYEEAEFDKGQSP